MEATRCYCFLLALIGTLGTAYSCSTCPTAEDDSFGWYVDSSSIEDGDLGPFLSGLVRDGEVDGPRSAAVLSFRSDDDQLYVGLFAFQDAEAWNGYPWTLGWSAGGAVTTSSSGDVQMIMEDPMPDEVTGLEFFCDFQRAVLTIRAATTDNPDGTVYVVPPDNINPGCEFRVDWYSDGCGVPTTCGVTTSVECNAQSAGSSFCQNMVSTYVVSSCRTAVLMSTVACTQFSLSR